MIQNINNINLYIHPTLCKTDTFGTRNKKDKDQLWVSVLQGRQCQKQSTKFKRQLFTESGICPTKLSQVTQRGCYLVKVYTFAHFLKNSVGKTEKETTQNTLALAAQ